MYLTTESTDLKSDRCGFKPCSHIGPEKWEDSVGCSFSEPFAWTQPQPWSLQIETQTWSFLRKFQSPTDHPSRCDIPKELWGMTGGSWKVESSQSKNQAALPLERQTRQMDNEIETKCLVNEQSNFWSVESNTF